MSGSARVLTGLMERRALEAAFQELALTEDVDQLSEGARQIATHGSAVVPILVSLLDTTDPQLRGGLGQVAALLERDSIAPALRSVARSRERSDNARLTAIMILERYLHEPIDEMLLAGLHDPEVVAIGSLHELSHEMERNPFVVIEYLNQLAEQPAQVAAAVLDAVPRLGPDPHMVTLLHVVAQGQDAPLAQKALEQLCRTRTPEAAVALVCLERTSPPPLSAVADRGLRKLKMQGITAPKPGDPTLWRALLSPVDGAGAQVAWFVRKPEDGGRGTLLSILWKDPEGIVASFGSRDVPADDLPPERELGSDYVIRQAEDAPPIRLLEVPLEAARLAVHDALELNWAGGTRLPMEYRLLSPAIWELGPLALPVDPEPVDYEPVLGAALLDHPAFLSWFWQAAPIYEAAGQMEHRPMLAERTAVVSTLLEAHFDSRLAESYGRRVACMARWLSLANDLPAARLARAVSLHLADRPPVDTSFFRRLVGIGLDVAVANLRSGFDLRHHPGEVA
jgi:hypothetical protein